eukprot:GHVU01147962.1.p1 GENE.GHVU01147962.1~~GHVU01147962.1.p1  ORF type:complete len:147 (+),score=14.07 GHVU01147962.1:437-877(+)
MVDLAVSSSVANEGNAAQLPSSAKMSAAHMYGLAVAGRSSSHSPSAHVRNNNSSDPSASRSTCIPSPPFASLLLINLRLMLLLLLLLPLLIFCWVCINTCVPAYIHECLNAYLYGDVHIYIYKNSSVWIRVCAFLTAFFVHTPTAG